MPNTYSADDERSHVPGDDEWWQESVFIQWFDPALGVGGVHRVGHEPNFDGGTAELTCLVFDRDGTAFRRGESGLPLRDPAELDGDFAAGGSRWTSGLDGPVFTVSEPDCELRLDVHDFYPRTDFFPPSGSLVDDIAKNHFEVSGRVTGRLVLDGRTYDVDGLCHRDHSWGIRRWDTVLSHRWVSGTFGPELSFGSISWHSADDHLVQAGYLVRNGEISYAESVDVVVHLEADGLTHRGGSITWTLTGGETFALECEAIAGVVTDHHGMVFVDSMCHVEWQGHKGTCDFEFSNNPRAGLRSPTLYLRAHSVDGMHRPAG